MFFQHVILTNFFLNLNLHLKKIPHYTTLQKFFQRLPTSILQELNKQILNHEINGEIIKPEQKQDIID